MPALPVVPNVLRLEYKQTYSSDLDVLTRTFWVWAGTTPTVGNLNTMAAACAAAYDANLTSLLSTDITLTETTLVALDSLSAAAGSSSASYSGSVGGGVLPAGTCFLVNYQIARRYRGGKPRSYWPFGVADKLNDPQHWTGAWVTDVSTQIGLWATAIEGVAAGGTTISGQCNVSYYAGFAPVQNPVTKRWRNIPTPRVGPVTYDPIIGTTFSPLIASQRRRSTRKR
jgi:hypothetical protein